jgi:hypothetical protein
LKIIFKRITLKNIIIKIELSFTLVHTNFGPPIKLFHHYAFSALGTPDNPSRNPVRETPYQPVAAKEGEKCSFVICNPNPPHGRAGIAQSV